MNARQSCPPRVHDSLLTPGKENGWRFRQPFRLALGESSDYSRWCLSCMHLPAATVWWCLSTLLESELNCRDETGRDVVA